MTKETDDKTSQQLRELSDRMEQLEASNGITSNHTELLLELVKIITEVPAGQLIFNRAVNRQQLDRLRSVILPRRQRALASFIGSGENSDMPPEIKGQFVAKQMGLIKSAIRAIQHREHYEAKASKNDLFAKFKKFTKLSNVKGAKLVLERHHITMRRRKHSLTHTQP